MKLYEIDNEIQKILDNMEIDEETGEAVLDVDALEALQLEREKKLEGVALAVKNLSAEAEAIKAEEDRLGNRRKAIVNRRDRMKEWLAQALDGGKLETARVRVSAMPGAQRLEIDEMIEVMEWMNDVLGPLADAYQAGDNKSGEEYKRIRDMIGFKTTYTMDKVGLKKLIKEFGEIPGCHLEDGKPSLRIV